MGNGYHSLPVRTKNRAPSEGSEFAVTNNQRPYYTAIESVHIRGFRSLADVKLDGLGQAVVLIGANGSGKSNLIRFFEMLSWMISARRLGDFVERQGGADNQLFDGRLTNAIIEAEIRLRTSQGRNDYSFTLTRAHPDRFFFTDEKFRFSQEGRQETAKWQHLGSAHREAAIIKAVEKPEDYDVNSTTARVIVNLLGSCAVYQFHDTSDISAFKKKWDLDSNSDALRSHGGNLAAVLYHLEHVNSRRYELICQQIRRVLPTFDRFTISERYGKVFLSWKARGREKNFGAHLTSDGSLRFFALATLLNLPPEMLPQVLLLDEPELGLHPIAIALVGDMIKSLSVDRQVIVATQSPLLVDAFDLDQVIAFNLKNGRTEPQILDHKKYCEWLDEYTVGELWQKNLLGAQP